MGVLFFIVVVIIFYILVIRMSRGTRTQGKTGNTKKPSGSDEVFQKRHDGKDKTGYRPVQTKVQKSQEKAAAAREHIKEKYMNEDSLRSEGRPEEVFQAAGIEADDGVILASAKLTSYAAEKDNEKIEDVDLLGPVYDLMIMGPDTSLSFERDFVSEGLELMNRYHQ